VTRYYLLLTVILGTSLASGTSLYYGEFRLRTNPEQETLPGETDRESYLAALKESMRLQATQSVRDSVAALGLKETEVYPLGITMQVDLNRWEETFSPHAIQASFGITATVHLLTDKPSERFPEPVERMHLCLTDTTHHTNLASIPLSPEDTHFLPLKSVGLAPSLGEFDGDPRFISAGRRNVIAYARARGLRPSQLPIHFSLKVETPTASYHFPVAGPGASRRHLGFITWQDCLNAVLGRSPEE
jgi:hypothetical protein